MVACITETFICIDQTFLLEVREPMMKEGRLEEERVAKEGEETGMEAKVVWTDPNDLVIPDNKVLGKEAEVGMQTSCPSRRCGGRLSRQRRCSGCCRS